MRTKSRALLAGIANGLFVALGPAWWPWLFGASNGTTVTPDVGWRLSPEYGIAAGIGMLVCLVTLGGAERYLSGGTPLRLGSVAIVALIPAAMVAAQLARRASPAPASYIAIDALLAFLVVSAVGAVFAVVALAVLHLTGPCRKAPNRAIPSQVLLASHDRCRQNMLEELERRNLASPTISRCLHAVEQFARHFKCPPDRLN